MIEKGKRELLELDATEAGLAEAASPWHRCETLRLDSFGCHFRDSALHHLMDIESGKTFEY